MTVELPYEIGTKVYYACAWGIEDGVIGYYEIFKNAVYARDKEGRMLARIENLRDNYEDAYALYESKYLEGLEKD